MNIELVLGHFGDRPCCLEPALSSFRRYFPEARAVLYTDAAVQRPPDGLDEIRKVAPPYERSHPRYGWRCSDLYRAVGLLESKADIAVYSDSDLFYCSDKVRTLIPLTRTFGFCLPANPRMLVRVDALLGADCDRELDDSQGFGLAWNSAPAFFYTACERARAYLENYEKIMRENPVRGPMAFYRAAYASGYFPCTLPFQWCLCDEQLGLGDEIVLHVGHKRVRDYYLGKGPRWLKEVKRAAFLFTRMYFPGRKNRAVRRFWDFS